MTNHAVIIIIYASAWRESRQKDKNMSDIKQ